MLFFWYYHIYTHANEDNENCIYMYIFIRRHSMIHKTYLDMNKIEIYIYNIYRDCITQSIYLKRKFSSTYACILIIMTHIIYTLRIPSSMTAYLLHLTMQPRYARFHNNTV